MLAKFSPTRVIPLMTKVSQVLDPFKLQARILYGYQHEMLYTNRITPLLIVLSAVHFVLFIVTVTTLALKFCVPRNGERKHIWLFRRRYLGDSQKVPYYVPNGEFAIEISQLFTCILVELFAFTSFSVAANPAAPGANLEYFWLAMGHVPCLFGFWYYACSITYIILLTPSRTSHIGAERKSFLTHPILLNIFCIGAPIIIALIFLGLSVRLIIIYNGETSSYAILQAALARLSADWKANDVTNISKIQELEPLYSNFYNWMVSFIVISRVICFFWSAVAVLVALFYGVTTARLYKILKDTANVASGKKQLCGSDSARAFTPDHVQAGSSSTHFGSIEVKSDILSTATPKTRLAYYLRRNQHFLAWHCATISISLLWYFLASVVYGVQMEKQILSQYWRVQSFCLIATSAIFISVAIILQSVRSIILNGRKACSQQYPEEKSSHWTNNSISALEC